MALRREFFWKWKDMSFFELECCEMSQFEVTMLQVKVGIVCDKFTVTPNFKDYYLGPPLGLDSCHPRSVLWSWPISVIRGYGSISSSIEIARTARDLFIDRLRCYHFLMLICSFCKLLSLARPTSPVLCKDVLFNGLSFLSTLFGVMHTCRVS